MKTPKLDIVLKFFLFGRTTALQQHHPHALMTPIKTLFPTPP